MFLLRKKKDQTPKSADLDQPVGHITKITVEKPEKSASPPVTEKVEVVEKTDDMIDKLLVRMNQNPPLEGQTDVPLATSTATKESKSPAASATKAATPKAPPAAPLAAPAKAPPVATPPPETPKPAAAQPEKSTVEDKDNLFDNLFAGTNRKEETPLDRLMNSLPEIGIDEVLNESQEVNDLISNWYQNNDNGGQTKP